MPATTTAAFATGSGTPRNLPPARILLATGGFGPWMVTTDEIPDVSKQTIATRLNGVEVQAAPISDLVFDVPALIAYCSTFTELVPGDVIVTGTTGGVGAYRTPPLWMKDGDVVEVEISGIGSCAIRSRTKSPRRSDKRPEPAPITTTRRAS